MDPNLFHVDWERTIEALGAVVVLSFIVERALAVIFESRMWVLRGPSGGGKELLAAAVGVAVCWHWQFDAVSIIVLREHVSEAGFVLTGLLVAGGSKASVKLFHDVLGVKSDVYGARHTVRAEAAVQQVETMVQRASTTAADGTTTTKLTEAQKKEAETQLLRAEAALLEAPSEALTQKIALLRDLLGRLG